MQVYFHYFKYAPKPMLCAADLAHDVRAFEQTGFFHDVRAIEQCPLLTWELWCEAHPSNQSEH